MRLVPSLLRVAIAAPALPDAASARADGSSAAQNVTPLGHVGGAGGRLGGDRFLLATARDLTVRGPSARENLRVLGTMQLPEVGSPQAEKGRRT